MKPIVVLTTLPAAHDAAGFSQKLVKAKLAACVNVLPGVESHYEWQGELVTDTEKVLFIKTRADKLTQLKQFFDDVHPYEVPELVVLPILAEDVPYVHWLNQVLG